MDFLQPLASSLQPERMRVGIALGSNLGDSKQTLTEAIKELKKIHQGDDLSFLVSSYYDTEPVDCTSDSPPFLNAVIQLETDLSPIHLLKHLRDLEISSGRSFPHLKNEPRTLDLDLLYCDSIVVSTPELTLPHPRIHERLFVLMPLAEIAPDLILPTWDKTAQEYYSSLINN